jgi:hypothetical protein
MADELPPRIIGLAICELADARVRAAWQYVEAWRVLTAAGVPVHDLRHALEAEQVRTQARDIVRAWAAKGARGLLVLHGPPGTGKTFAAARWAIALQSEGRGVVWQLAAEWPYAFAEQDAWAKRGRKAGALVVDDLGTGQTKSKEAIDAIQAMLQVRYSADLPTIMLSNANAAETRLAIGERIYDRLKLGGAVREISERPSLRKLDDVELDDVKRSPRWAASAGIVAAIGCERVDGALDLGGAVGSAKSNANAIKVLGLDEALVLERGRLVLEREAATAERLRRELGIDVDPAIGLTFGQFASGLVGKTRATLDADRRKREADLQTKLAQRIPQQLNPNDVDTAQAIAKRAGIYVRGNADQGFEAVASDGRAVARDKSRDRAWILAAASLPGEAVPA